jgi:SOS-response transcriptional repressor LexA
MLVNDMTEQEFKKLQDQHNRAQEELAEAKGALRTLQDRLKDEFGLNSSAEARARLKALGVQQAVAQKELERLLFQYRKDFPSA